MKYFGICIVVLLCLFVFRHWIFSLDQLSAGDWGYMNIAMAKDFPIFPSAWNPDFMLGSNTVYLLGLTTYYYETTKLFLLFFHLPWVVVERLIWYLPYIILSCVSSWFLVKKLLPKNPFLFAAPIMYTLNTYSLMITGGGQMGVAMSYAFLPFVFLQFIKTYHELSFRNSVILGITIAIELLLDIRITYLVLFGLVLYWLWIALVMKHTTKKLLQSFARLFLLPGVLVILLHAFWIIPLIIGHRNPITELGAAYSSPLSVKFLSFATFENTLSLLHPNWPENIFGKVGFMRPEFLLLPLLVFLPLLKSGKKLAKNDNTEWTQFLFFALLLLIGAFLAKGANDPFGGLYVFLFTYLPGFSMFRDSTKWYMLIAVSYAVLVPYSLQIISEYVTVLRRKMK